VTESAAAVVALSYRRAGPAVTNGKLHKFIPEYYLGLAVGTEFLEVLLAPDSISYYISINANITQNLFDTEQST
jgi:hypothetical protein